MVNIHDDRYESNMTVPISKWDPKNFNSLMTLGKGNYGTVYLIESLHTKQLYAMKARSKRILQVNEETESASIEKSVLLLAKTAKHPFVVDIFGGYQTSSHIMIFMEFCQGGSLMHHLQVRGKFTIEQTRFYAGEVSLALKWLHDMRIIYRNLSLDDTLLGLDGHIKLVDFVVSKVGVGPESRTSTFCGSSEFMAPEILLDRHYSSSIDWWQLGIISYQMMTQQSPFHGDSEDEIYDSILKDSPPIPADMAIDTADFVQGLLIKEPDRRLGCGANGAEQVMAHAFFTDINWDALYEKRISAPFVPTVITSTDISNFEPDGAGRKSSIYDTEEELLLNEQELFSGFEFTAE